MLFLLFLSITLGLSCRYHLIFSILLFILTLCFLIIKSKKKRITYFIVMLLGFSCTSLLTVFFPNNNSTASINCTGIIITSKDNYYIIRSLTERYYVYDKDSKYEVGDILTIKGDASTLESKNIDTKFDFVNYLATNGVTRSITNIKIEERFLTPLRLKEFKKNYLLKYDDSSRSIVKAILFSSLEDDEYTSTFEELHLNKLLLSAGVYVALFYKLIVSIFSLFMKRKYSELIGIGSITLYSVFLFPKFSIIRLLTMKIFSYINNYFLNNKISYLNRLAITGLFFIFIDRYITYQVSFILGYSFSIFNYFLIKILTPLKRNKKIILRYLFLFIFTIPLELYFYHELSILGYVLSIILTPLFLLIGLLSFLNLLFIPLTPIINHLIYFLNYLLYYFSFINFKIYSPPLNDVILFIYYLLLILYLYHFEIKFIPIKRILFIVIVSFISIYLLPINNIISSEVTFISVGQGDSTLIRKGNTAILIDTGGLTSMDIAKESLIPLLKRKRIYDIDLVITTHDDYDHVGALTSLSTHFKVKKYIKDDAYFPIKINDIEIKNYNIYGDNYQDENDKSLVLGFNLFSTNFLIMGDAPSYIEKRIIEDNKNIPCDILKVGHHGSNTSSSEAFIKYLSPKTAIISCGKNNKYHHPNKEVIDVLNKYKINIRRTDKEGSITYTSYFSF